MQDQLRLKDFKAAYQQVREPITEAEVKALSFPNDYERQQHADLAASHIEKASQHREQGRNSFSSADYYKNKDRGISKLHQDAWKHHDALVTLHTELASRHATRAHTAPKESAKK